MTDENLVYLFKLAKRRGFVSNYENAACISQCADCPADSACKFISEVSDTCSYPSWLDTYQAFKARANFRPSIETILKQHPEFLV